VLGHNGNLTNSEQLKNDLFRLDMRHVNTESDSEVLLNVLAHELAANTSNYKLDPATIFAAVSGVHRRCRGAYAVVAMIAGYGLLAFRDPRHPPAGSAKSPRRHEHGGFERRLDGPGFRWCEPGRGILSTSTATSTASSAETPLNPSPV
jgi:hypothetical protein